MRVKEIYIFESGQSTRNMYYNQNKVRMQIREKKTDHNQLRAPDTAGVLRRRFALGSGVGLDARFEFPDNPFEFSHKLLVFRSWLFLFCT